MNKYLGVIRAPFLPLAPICMSLGVVTAYISRHSLDWLNLAIALTAGLCAHASVNALNEYLDFSSGLDFKTTKTPFSGGSGALIEHPEFARRALVIGVVLLAVTILAGFYLALTVGWGLLPLGLLGVLIIVTYTPWINQNAFLCLIASGTAFGPIMVIGTNYALTGEFSSMAAWASLVPFFLVCNLLLLNQFPDVEADREVGRHHLPIKIGRQASSTVFGIFLLLVYVTMVLAVLFGEMPVSSLLGLITFPAALFLYNRVRAGAETVELLIPSMGLNVLLVLSTPLFLCLGLYQAA